MSRHPQWERRLREYLAGVRTEPHSYGRNDCMLHVANAVKAVTGKDHGRGHRRKYDSAAKAARHLKSKGFDSPEAFLDSLFDEIPVGFAQRGDIALTPANDGTGWALPGVVIGDVALVIATGAVNGLYPVHRREWLKAWKVGR